MIEKIEQTILGHFRYLPDKLGFETKRYQGLHIINCGLGSSMFNIVFGCPIDKGNQCSSIITNVIQQFKGQPFAWWIPPTQRSKLMTYYLNEAGLHTETTEHIMIYDLASPQDFKLKTNLKIRQVITREDLQNFITVIEPYDKTARKFYEKLKISHLDSQEKLFIGYNNNKPFTIGILFEGDNACGIFSLITCAHAQNKGFGTDMMRYLLDFSKKTGRKHVILSASSDSGYRIYERLGFKNVGFFECFEYPGNV